MKSSYWNRCFILAVYLAIWGLLWSKLLLPYLSQLPDAGSEEVIALTCRQANELWLGKNAACGLDSENCPLVDIGSDVIFRCPALCDHGSWLYLMRAVGDQLIKYRGYYIGGGRRIDDDDDVLSNPYRADSFPCGAAVHSGLVSPIFGGCARISYSSGPQTSFEGVLGYGGASDSIGFDSFFPYLYYFKELAARTTLCYDPRLMVLLLNIILGIPVVFLGSGAAFFWIMSVVGFWTITLATDPPVLVRPEDPESFYLLISLSLERFLPTCFVLFCLWKVSVKRTFGGLTDYLPVSVEEPSTFEVEEDAEEYAEEGIAPRAENAKYSSVTRILLWYPFFWLGILNNVTFDRLPVDRLMWSDLVTRPGALLTVAVVASVIVMCIIAQAYYVWKLGRFWRLLLVYGMIFSSLAVFSLIPGLSLRIHHYIFGLIFIPGCSTRGQTAYVFQGLLLGLFISGVARWGFASIAETNISLLRGEPTGRITPPIFESLNDGFLTWADLSTRKDMNTDIGVESYNGVSLLINDVERYRGPNNGGLNLTDLFETNEELKGLLELLQMQESPESQTSLYLRMAKFDPEHLRYGDYSRASIVEYPSFNFTLGPPGIT